MGSLYKSIFETLFTPTTQYYKGYPVQDKNGSTDYTTFTGSEEFEPKEDTLAPYMVGVNDDNHVQLQINGDQYAIATLSMNYGATAKLITHLAALISDKYTITVERIEE